MKIEFNINSITHTILERLNKGEQTINNKEKSKVSLNLTVRYHHL